MSQRYEEKNNLPSFFVRNSLQMLFQFAKVCKQASQVAYRKEKTQKMHNSFAKSDFSITFAAPMEQSPLVEGYRW
jgi:hypothetical protein